MKTYDRLGRQLFVFVCSLVMALITGMGVVDGLRMWGNDRVGDAVTVLLMAVGPLLVVMAVRGLRLKIVAGAEDVRVVSWLRSRTVPWTQVARIEPPPEYGRLVRTGIQFVLTDGSVLADEAFGRAGFDLMRDTDRVLRELEDLRRAAWVRHGLLDGPEPGGGEEPGV